MVKETNKDTTKGVVMTLVHMVGVLSLVGLIVVVSPAEVGISCAIVASLIVIVSLKLRPIANSGAWTILAAGIVLLGLAGRPGGLGASVADSLLVEAARLVGYTCLFVGLVKLTPRHGMGDGILPLIDATIFAIGAMLLAWIMLLQSIIGGTTSGDVFDMLWRATSPLADVLIVVVLAQMIFSGVTHSPSFRMLAFAVMVFLLSDFGTSWSADSSNGGLLWATDVGRALGYMMVAAAASHPSSSWFAKVPCTTEPDRF